MNNKIGIYIHIPFCVRKCPYCGFYSVPLPSKDDSNKWNRPSCSTKEDGSICSNGSVEDVLYTYKNRILAEIKEFAESTSGYIVDSIFFGGGTPSIMPAEYIDEILTVIDNSFHVTYDCEISLEANPFTISASGLRDTQAVAYSEAVSSRVNRLSIGVQSFDDEVLKTLGRVHNAAEAEEAFRAAREAGFYNINIDLMFGIPGQSIKQWERTLNKAIELNPEHISFYSLQIEEGTTYFERFERDEFDELPDEIDRKMYHLAIKRLKAAGYKHYEISNAAKPGFECRHNLKYWTGQEYVGFGDSAASYINGARYTMMNGERMDLHINSKFDDMSEYAFTGLRLTSGLNYGEFKSKFGIDFREAFADRWGELKEFFDSGALVQCVDAEGRPNRLALTEKGIDISNKIMAVFV